MKRTVVKKTISLYRRQRLARAMVLGYRAMASDRHLAEDLVLWDATLMDGLSDEDDSAR